MSPDSIASFRVFRFLRMRSQIEVGAVCNTHQFIPLSLLFVAFRKEPVLNVDGPLGIVGQLFFRLLIESQVFGCQSDRGKPLKAGINPFLRTGSSSPGLTKYSISICSNSRVRKIKFPGVTSLRNDFPIWATPNGSFRLLVVSTLTKLIKILCAVSGLR